MASAREMETCHVAGQLVAQLYLWASMRAFYQHTTHQPHGR